MNKKMSRLWAPWRVGYISGLRRSSSKTTRCLFCRGRSETADSADHLLTRGRLAFSLLNRYPYNNGHLMVAPYRHVGQLSKLTPPEWTEMLELVNDAMSRLDQVMHPKGYNLGINIGRVAGAGIPGHLHLHIVPRWSGDTNFMPAVTGAKVISQSLEASYQLLKGAQKNRHAKKA